MHLELLKFGHVLYYYIQDHQALLMHGLNQIQFNYKALKGHINKKNYNN